MLDRMNDKLNDRLGRSWTMGAARQFDGAAAEGNHHV
jgi:hypothetical protein